MQRSLEQVENMCPFLCGIEASGFCVDEGHMGREDCTATIVYLGEYKISLSVVIAK